VAVPIGRGKNGGKIQPLFTVRQVRRAAAASVVVIMDSLAGYRWHVPERLDAIQRTFKLLFRRD
jgi:hypothetical protein